MDLLDRSNFRLSPTAKKILIGTAAMAAGGLVIAGATAGLAAAALSRRRSSFSLNGKVVFITGGSRGLGLGMA
ncbi:MAG TPA: hypothetical protein VG498_16840, partial [Terriglobales bacterium]|nr:hypothetical protein [Terriglobales bacterium]